jgi:glycerate kinase
VRVVIAPDSFKGTLTAPRATEAIAQGWLLGRPDDSVIGCPLSDGGDGLLEILRGRDGWRTHSAAVQDPLGRPVAAQWQTAVDIAVIETAQACGLALVESKLRDPLRLTSYGVGQLMQTAAEDAPGRFVIGLGGSATVDGGLGLLTALGAVATDARGNRIHPGRAADLADVHRFDLADAAGWLDRDVAVLCDVTTPLPESAAAFGPQKGATPEDVRMLERLLDDWATRVEGCVGAPGLRLDPATGAAGGLGFALRALGATMVDGAGYLADVVGLDKHLAQADLLIVGEGKLDATSFAGKVVGMLSLAQERSASPSPR